MKNLRRVVFAFILLWTLGVNTACKKNLAKLGAKTAAESPAAKPAAKSLGAKPKTVEQELAGAGAQLKEIPGLLEAHDYRAAGEINEQVFERLEELRGAGGGPKLGAEIARLQNQITDQVTAVLQKEVDALRKGAPDNVNIPRLLRCFPRAGEGKLAEIYAAALPELDRIRRVHAPQWIRVEAVEEIVQFGAALEAIGNRITVPPGYRVVYGRAAGPQEESATYCTFTLSVRPQIEKYVESKSPQSRVSAEGLLVGLTLELKLRSRSPERILSRVSRESLDREGTLHLAFGQKGGTPDTIAIPDGTTMADFFRTRNRERSAEFDAAIKHRFGLMSPFQFAESGGTPQPLSSDQALFDRPAFIAALRAAPPGAKSDEAWCRVAELGIEELAPDLAKRLPAFNLHLRPTIMRALKAQPWFGDYEPLLQCIRAGDAVAFSEALKVLGTELGEPRVLAEIQARFVRQPEFASWMLPLAESISPQNLPALLASYPRLPAAARAPLVTGLMSKHRGAAGPLLSDRLAAADAAELVELSKGMGAAFRGTPSRAALPATLTASEQTFLLAAISKLQGEQRVTALYATAWLPGLWVALFDQPREKWSPKENLVLSWYADTGGKDDSSGGRRPCWNFA
ncbi:MAG TPA: hypothetical protein VHO24_05120 [Opitutaceae bacterium]|nr:hypothetical protein [Opitutaceae bacterium]